MLDAAHRRRSTRLQGYDYRNAGAYFISICTWQREILFGDVIDREIKLNELGEIVQDEWLRTEVIRPDRVSLDAFVIMPNHLHGIIFLHDVGATGRSPLQNPPIRLLALSQNH